MKVLLFGGTGMVGQGVLRECLRDPDVTQVRSVVRVSSGKRHEKLVEDVVPDVDTLGTHDGALRDFDACFFCLGVSSAGMAEAKYERLTYRLTLTVMEPLAPLNPAMTLVYVSGSGTDSTESGRTMWARVKGRTENALLRLPFKAAYMFRPGFIQPMHGVRSKTPLYNTIYTLVAPFVPLVMKAFPKHVLTTEEVGQAMLIVAKRGAPKRVLEIADLRALLSDEPTR